MSGRKLDSELIGFGLEVFHEAGHAGRDCSEIVVGELLVFGGSMADHCPVAEAEVRTGIVESLVDQEVLLLDSEVDRNGFHAAVEEFRYFRGSGIEGLQRA